MKMRRKERKNNYTEKKAGNKNPCLVLYIRKYQDEVIFFTIGINIPPMAFPAATVSMYDIS